MIRRRLRYLVPETAFTALAGLPFAHFLSGSALATHCWGGEWRIIVAAPSETLVVRNGQIFRDGVALGSVESVSPFQMLAEMSAARRSAVGSDFADAGLPPFLSGAVGHLDYEMAQLLEPTLNLPYAAMATMAFGYYDAVAAWRMNEKGVYIFARSEESADRLEQVLGNGAQQCPVKSSEDWPTAEVVSNKSRRQHVSDIRFCIDQILAGEIFQVNLSRLLTASYEQTDMPQAVIEQLFRKWVARSASGFACLMQYENLAYLSNSPERFFSVTTAGEQLRVTAEPVKGTRARHSDPAQDSQIAKELLADEKDRAENIMIADLMRNDLSRVCQDGTIEEEKICELQTFADVHHLVSRITGLLQPGKSAVDVLAAAFPCGSITGAPKIRAMEIIADIEARQRGIYCGTIGYIDDRGTADFSVAIRTAELTRAGGSTRISYGTGGGITALSDPLQEFEETTVKAEAFRKLIDLTQCKSRKPT